jgi:hypothetical protein
MRFWIISRSILMVLLLSGPVGAADAAGYYCIAGVHIPMTDGAAQSNQWSPDGAFLAGIAFPESRASPDKTWGPPYPDHRICKVYVDPGHLTYAWFGDGHACQNAWSKSPADACQKGDVSLKSDRQVLE